MGPAPSQGNAARRHSLSATLGRAVPLSRSDVAALVAFLEALDGEGRTDVAPAAFPP